MAKTKMKKRAARPIGRSVEVEHAGKKIKGISYNFEPEREPWNIYRLSNGARLKIKLILSDVIVTKEKVSEDIPLVLCRIGNVVVYEPEKKGT